LKNFLPDINVWVALLAARHVHNKEAIAWISEAADGSVALCRIAQMGLLRLLTNERAMGPDVVTSARAWELHDQMMSDPRFYFLPEPDGLERAWRAHTHHERRGHAGWTDAYVAAFAKAANLRLVTFDKQLKASSADTVIL